MIGATFVGVPAWIGKNSYVSLAFTVNHVDSHDLYK
jgi:acyl-homoserine lactone acylase PvdQ